MYMANPMIFCTCGFFLNLNFVLLKFCEPFDPDLKAKTILKVDCRYCAANSTVETISKTDPLLHAVGYANEDKLISKPDSSKAFLYYILLLRIADF